jgi:hypothetical protein
LGDVNKEAKPVDKDEEKVPAVIEAAMGRPPEPFWFTIVPQRVEHRMWALARLPMHAKLFEHVAAETARAILGLNRLQKKTWLYHEVVQALFLSRIPKTVFSGFQQTIDGDYAEALATCRIAYETVLRVIFIAKHPVDVQAALCDAKGKRAFRAANVLTQDLKVTSEDPLYESLSFPIHSMKLHVVQDIIKASKAGSVGFDLGFAKDEKQLYRSFNIIITVTYFAARIVNALFGTDLATVSISGPDTAAMEKLISDWPGKSLSEFPRLVDKIIEEIGPPTTASCVLA